MHRTPIFQIFSEVKRKDRNEMKKATKLEYVKQKHKTRTNISVLTINVNVLNSSIKS